MLSVRVQGRIPLLVALLLSLVGSLAATQYACPVDQCKLPGCMCASNEAPLEPETSVPQFIVMTNDDAATVVTTPAMLAVLEKYTNRNGCPLPATWFISIEYTQKEYVQMLYMKGHEIATHTLTHVGLPGVAEIVGARTWLNQTAHVPLEKIRGFRGPFLLHNEEQRNILASNGFLYDSTITSTWGRNSFSPDGAHKVWPFTFDYGSPIDCSIGTGNCSVVEKHLGLWEFPLWNLQDEYGNSVASMDPVGNITELYVRELLRNYNGNRAPVGLYLHAARMVGSQEVADQYAAFLEYALSLPDVWVVTIAEVLRWMTYPVPAWQYRLSCPTPTDMYFPGGRFCLPPTGGCIQGTWAEESCACTCLNQRNASLPGFCPDPFTGACVPVKQYNSSTGTFFCLSASNGGDGASSGTSTSTGTSSSPSTGTTTTTTTSSMESSTTGTSTSTGTGSIPTTISTPIASSSSPSSTLPAAAGSSELSTTSTPASTTTASSSTISASTGVADVQPLGGVRFAFDVQGELASFINKAQAVCDVVAALAGEVPSTCTLASVTEAAAPTGSTRRLSSTGYLHVIVVINPAASSADQVASYLAAAMQDGRLADTLSAIGVKLVGTTTSSGTSVDVLSAAPSSNKGTVAAAVGGAVGGIVLIAVAVAVFFVLRAHRTREASPVGKHKGLPVAAMTDDAKHKASPPTKGISLLAKAGPMRANDVRPSAYASTPRNTATPRHTAAPTTFGTAPVGNECNV